MLSIQKATHEGEDLEIKNDLMILNNDQQVRL